MSQPEGPKSYQNPHHDARRGWRSAIRGYGTGRIFDVWQFPCIRKQKIHRSPLKLPAQYTHTVWYRDCAISDTRNLIYNIPNDLYSRSQNSTEATRAALFSFRGLIAHLNGAGWLREISVGDQEKTQGGRNPASYRELT